MQQAMRIENREVDLALTDKPVYRDQALADWIDGEEKTFEGDGAEQRRTIGCDKALSSDFVAVQSQTCLRHGPNISLPTSDHDALRPNRFQLKPFSQRPWYYSKGSAGVDKQLNFFATPCWAGQPSLYVKQSHLKSLLKRKPILT
jgi:hypothetical protein